MSVLIPSPFFSIGAPLLSDADCLGEIREEEPGEEEEEEKEMVGLIPSEILLAEDNGLVDPAGSPQKEQVSEDLQGCKSGMDWRATGWVKLWAAVSYRIH